jgi:hypothetical protein
MAIKLFRACHVDRPRVIGGRAAETSQACARTSIEVGQAKLSNAEPLCRRVAATGNLAS